MQQPLWWRMILLAVLLPRIGLNGIAQNIAPTMQVPCSGSEWHEFDFWLGSWVVMDGANGSNIAQARIEPVSHGCALREEYRSTDGEGGESLAACGATGHFPTWRTTKFDGATSILMSVRGTATVSSWTLRPA
jgi:hypothetical protein